MRGTNGPMDVVTRAEFDHSMKDMLTKEDLQAALAGTSAEVASIKDKLDDIKVDLLGSIETKFRETKSSTAFQMKSDLADAKAEILAATKGDLAEAKAEILAATKGDLADAKAEILAATKSDLADAKAEILAVTKSDLADAKVEILATTRRDIAEAVDQGILKNAARLDAMEHKINTIVIDGYRSLEGMMTSFTAEMREIVKHHERRLDRHDADLYKLRQSGVLQ